MFSADPGGNDSSTCQVEEERGSLADESVGAGPLFGEVGIFTKLRVVASFFKASDALDAVEGMGIKDVVVANPKFEGKAGPDGDYTVESCVVANGPRKAAQDNQQERADGNAPGELNYVSRTKRDPKQQKR